ncbi:YeeE/YedE family protein [Myxococcota bacterium]|nr:YeeE/YedE family protein [Myxococcota bacterium]
MLPLYGNDVFSYATAMAMAAFIGVGFGFILERSGFGRASILVSQFYGTDNRVLKVMFTAIATATAGLGLLSGVGVVDIAGITIPDTFWLPQLVGGLMLGVGFAVSGYCPGTALVAAGSGNRDGWFSILGTMAGGLVFAVAWPWLEGFYTQGAMGPLTLPQLLGLPWAVVATGVVAMAVGAFLLAEKGEAFFSRRAGMAPPASSAPRRNLVFGLLGATSALGIASLALPQVEPVAPTARVPVAQDAVALAEALVVDPHGLWIVDLRPTTACEAARVPGALCLPAEDPAAAFIADLSATRRLVLYGEGDLAGLPAAAERWPGEVAVLRGGWAAFQASVLTAPVPPAEATPEAVERYRHLAALHGQLTGSKAPPPPVVAKPTAVARAVKKGGGC